jgi:hypothetical protein
MLVDVGATFGGAGRTSDPILAKMNLEEWRRHSVFMEPDPDGVYRGRLSASMAARRQGERDPVISERAVASRSSNYSVPRRAT